MFDHHHNAGVKPTPLRTIGSPTKFTEEHMERRKFPRPMPLPEVVEGDGGSTDWGMFEEAVASQQKVK